jgi:hypothetical protein
MGEMHDDAWMVVFLGGHAIFSTPRRHGDVYQKWHRSTASFWR